MPSSCSQGEGPCFSVITSSCIVSISCAKDRPPGTPGLGKTTLGPLNCPNMLSFPDCPQCGCMPVHSNKCAAAGLCAGCCHNFICFGPTNSCSSRHKRLLQKKSAGELWLLDFNLTKFTLHGNNWQLLVSSRELNSLGIPSIPNDGCGLWVFSVLPLGLRHVLVWLIICHHPANHRGFWSLLMAIYSLLWSYQTTCALEVLNTPRSTVG